MIAVEPDIPHLVTRFAYSAVCSPALLLTTAVNEWQSPNHQSHRTYLFGSVRYGTALNSRQARQRSAISKVGSSPHMIGDAGAFNESRQGTKAHRFVVSHVWTKVRLAVKPAIAVAIALAIGQNTAVASVESTTAYLSAIFTVLFMANKTRVSQIEQTLVGGVLIGAMVPFGMLMFLCSHATRSLVQDQVAAQTYAQIRGAGGVPSLAVFYQGPPAAVAAVFLFIVAWWANTAKTLFPVFTFCVVAAAIVGAILCLQGYLAPTWATYYTLIKQVIYNGYIGIAISLAVSLLVFPYNAREPYLKLTSEFLDLTQKMIAVHADHFGSTHLRMKQARDRSSDLEASTIDSPSHEAQDSEKSRKSSEGDSHRRRNTKKEKTKDEIAELQALRGSMTAIASALELAKKPAKREIAYGHLDSQKLQQMHKLGRSLIVPLLGCNLWSQIAGELRQERARVSESTESSLFLQSLGIAGKLTAKQEADVFTLMEDQIAPRLKILSLACQDAVEHIQRGLHLGLYKRPPFYLRPFIKSPKPYDTEDAKFCDQFESIVANFWAKKHLNSGSQTRNGDSPEIASLLIIYMETALHGTATKLLEFGRWVDTMQSTGVMTNRHVILPKAKRYTNALRSTLASLRHHDNDGEQGISRLKTGITITDTAYEDRTYRPDAAEVFLNKAKPAMVPRSGLLSSVLFSLYRVKVFVFESSVSAFGFRAAIATMAGSLPAYFASSIGVFLEYRLIWISITVFLSLQPVLGRGLVTMIFRMIGTIIGGVIGLVVVEIGRVPAGIIPVLFVSIAPQFYLLQVDPKKYLLPVLLSTITEILIVGYRTSADKLGVAVIESSGQAYLQSPALMGYRILLTLAGVVLSLIFSIFPSLPTARRLLRDTTASHLLSSAETYMLVSVRAASGTLEIPAGLDKAIVQKQMESLALSAASNDFLQVAVFELSPRGVFPAKEWTRLLSLLDNFNAALAVANNLFGKLSDSTALLEEDTSKSILQRTNEHGFRVSTSTLLAVANSINLWQTLPPVLPSPMQNHLEMIAQVREMSIEMHQKIQGGNFNAINSDAITYLSAYMIMTAIMAKYLEDIVLSGTALVGVSGFKTYIEKYKD